MPLVKVKVTVEILVEASNLPQGLDYALSMVNLPNAPATGSGSLVERKSQVPREWIDKKPFNANGGGRSMLTCDEIMDVQIIQRKVKKT